MTKCSSPTVREDVQRTLRGGRPPLRLGYGTDPLGKKRYHEAAYDRQSHIGMLDKGLDEAAQRGWTVVDMKKDWKIIFPPAKK